MIESGDNDRSLTRAHLIGAGLADAPPAEPRSRQDYADYMRQEPAAGADDDDTSGKNGTRQDDEPGHGESSRTDAGPAPGMPRAPTARADEPDLAGNGQSSDARYEPRWDDPAGQAQGMGRSRYADYMHQGPAAGHDDPGTNVARPSPDLAEQSAERLTPPAAVAENGAGTQEGRNALSEPGEDGSHPAEPQAGQRAIDNGDPSGTSTAGDQPDPAGADLDQDDPELTPQGEAVADHSTGADSRQSEPTETPEENADTPLSPEAQQLKALEAENAQARQKIADLEAKNADLEAKSNEQGARLDRIEQQLASPDRNPGDSSAPEHGADEPVTSRDQDAVLAKREGTDQDSNIKDAEPSRWRRVVTADNVSAAGTLIGAADTIAQFAMHATADGVAGLATTLLGMAALGLAKAEKNKKEKRDDRADQRQG